MPVTKKDVLELLDGMPEVIDLEEFLYRLYLKQKLEASEAAAERGELIPHAEVGKRIAEWRK